MVLNFLLLGTLLHGMARRIAVSALVEPCAIRVRTALFTIEVPAEFAIT